MNQWEFRIAPCVAGGYASATCLKMLGIRFADVPCASQFALVFCGAM